MHQVEITFSFSEFAKAEIIYQKLAGLKPYVQMLKGNQAEPSSGLEYGNLAYGKVQHKVPSKGNML